MTGESNIAGKIEMEIQRRDLLWTKISSISSNHVVQPQALTELAIYGGGRGIWTNKQITAALYAESGVTVSVFHTGRHYPDELSDKYLVYHYPKTAQEGKDKQEIRATKRACQLRLPVFVITIPEDKPRMRMVRRGFVLDSNDSDGTFCIQFDEGIGTPPVLEEVADDAPFNLTDNADPSYSRTKTRPNQPRFNYEVRKRYGDCCAVCDVSVKEMLQAAHICGKSEDGADDPRNGIVLCANHHRAFDEFLFSIDPSTLAVLTKANGPGASALMISRKDIGHLSKKPHRLALEWHYDRFSNSEHN